MIRKPIRNRGNPKAAQPKKVPRPLKSDPSRTGALRKAFVAELRKRFKNFRLHLYQLVVDEDAFGLNQFTNNTFCPTGPGGGLDNSCDAGTSGGGDQVITTAGLETKLPLDEYGFRRGAVDLGAVSVKAFRVGPVADPTGRGAVFFAGDKDSLAPYAKLHEGHQAKEYTIHFKNALLAGHQGDLSKKFFGKHYGEMMDQLNHRLKDGQLAARAFDKKIADAARKAGYDGIVYTSPAPPAKTEVVALGKKWNHVVANIAVTNTRFAFRTDPEKVKAFQEWIKTQVKTDILGSSDDSLWRRYIEAGFKKGMGRSYQDVKPAAKILDEDDSIGFYRGGYQQFVEDSFRRPETTDKVKLLAGRVYSDLDGVTDQMEAEITRHLTDGLIQGLSPREIAKGMSDSVDGIGLSRAETIARTEIVRAHAEGQLQAMSDLGIDEVGVAVEWTVTEDTKLCPKCKPLEGVVLKLDEASGLIPRHPNCRCCWIPANVGEDSEDQKDTKKQIESAIDESDDGEGWGDDIGISGSRPKSIFNQLRAGWGDTDFFGDAVLNDRDCGTGAGGFQPGNSCGKSAGGSHTATKPELTATRKIAYAKIRNAPVPDGTAVAKARAELERAKEGQGRAGGESRGGSAASRRKQRENLFEEFGGKEKGYVVCHGCGLKCHHSADNPDGLPRFERGKIFTKFQGGGYQLPNLLPECFGCNRSRNDKPVRKENLK